MLRGQPLDVQRVFILAVDPKESVVEEIRAALDPGIPVRWARNEAEALENDRSHRWLGVVVGPTIGDTAGLELLQRLVSHSSADVAAALPRRQRGPRSGWRVSSSALHRAFRRAAGAWSSDRRH